jgi:hypothetical protein
MLAYHLALDGDVAAGKVGVWVEWCKDEEGLGRFVARERRQDSARDFSLGNLFGSGLNSVAGIWI